jgi:hypothetical protein
LEVSYLYARSPRFESAMKKYVEDNGFGHIEQWGELVKAVGFKQVSPHPTGAEGRLERLPWPGDVLALPTVGQWIVPHPSHVVVAVAHSAGKGQQLCFEKQSPGGYYQLVPCDDIGYVEIYRPPAGQLEEH